VADDAHFCVGVVAQTFGKAIEDGGEVALDVGAAGVKRDVAGDVQLELVVRGLVTPPVPWVAASISRFCFSRFCDQI
jgi:hypothetical protein